MENEVLSENIYKNIPRLAPSRLEIVSQKFQISEARDFSPEGDSRGKSISWNTISKAVLFRDNYSCRICERSSLSNVSAESKYDKLHFNVQVHHIIPRKDGGKDTFSNLITLCEECHRKTFSSGYGGLPVDGQSTIYNFEYSIKLCVQPSWIDGSGLKVSKGKLKDHRRVFDPEENIYKVVPSVGEYLEIHVVELNRKQYHDLISNLSTEFAVSDYVTFKISGENGWENARVLITSNGQFLL